MSRQISLVLLLVAVVPASAAEPRAGAGAVIITPAVGTPMAGYYRARAAEGVHDDLYARALVLEQDGVKAALVSLDLISTTPQIVKDARRAIQSATGIPGQNVMISATHAHTGPVLSATSVRDSFLGGDSSLVRHYLEELPEKIAKAVAQAEKNLKSVHILAGAGHEASIAFNRRYHMKDGTVGWNPGLLNPKIDRPAGPIDPEVPIVYFETQSKKPLATYVNYAVHLDNVGGDQFSADMLYTLAKCLAEAKGADMMTLYTTGTCGDVNQVNVKWGERQSGFGQAARMGVILAAEVLRNYPKLHPVEARRLRTKTALVSLPLPEVEQADADKALAYVRGLSDKTKKNTKTAFLDTVGAFKILDVAARQGKPHQVEVQVIAWGGDVAWVSLPGEIFVELGLAIKQDSPFKHTILAELANGSVGYIPTRRAYAQGNYEVVSTRCAEGSGEILVEAALGLLKELHGN